MRFVSSNSQINRKQRTRILLVDDHPLVRERLAEVINREPDLTVCAEAEERHQALERVVTDSPDLAIIDLTLKNSDGLELIKDLHARWPKLLILVVSMHDESLYAERVIRAGALGYITKQEATRNILCAIRRVRDGRVYLNDRIATRIIGQLATRAERNTATPVDLLANRELQVFEMTGRGLNTRQIATQLHLGVKTVETYRARIREKLRLKEPSELLQVAIAWAHDGQGAFNGTPKLMPR
jgi:DNA-binding NarL/FixJ family response regulator